jgi:hypothetical protein
MLAHAILASAEQAWPPFVLVAGLLLIGTVAAQDGLFEASGARLLVLVHDHRPAALAAVRVAGVANRRSLRSP